MTSCKTCDRKHPLEMTSLEGAYRCDGCMMDGLGPRYRCETCNYDLHRDCMLAPLTVTFQGHECQFLEKHCPRVDCKGCRSCDACGITIRGFSYRCGTTGMDFHPKCSKLQNEICIGDVRFRLHKGGLSKCQGCNKKRVKGSEKKIPGWSYTSIYGCDFHVYCVMKMAMESPSPSTSSITTDKGNTGDLGLGLQGMELPLKLKPKGIGGGKGNNWLDILKIFLRTVLSILLGDPSTVLVSTLAHVVTQGLLHIG